MKQALLAASLAMIFGCAPGKEQRSEVAPLELKAAIDGNHIMLFYSIEPGIDICVNGHGLRPTPLDTYPDHGTEGKVVNTFVGRSDVLRSYFSEDGTLAKLEVWRNEGATPIDIYEAPEDGSIELNVEMTQCSELFSKKEVVNKYTFYREFSIPIR